MTTDANCLFCKIAAGEIPADIVASDDAFIAFRDIAPKAATHVLIVPREHSPTLDDWVASGGDSTAALAFASSVAASEGVAGGYRLIVNVGARGGQEVFHLHWHLLAGDTLPGF